ncbi:MAG: ABC transporter permease [Pseudomonadota bacterium]
MTSRSRYLLGKIGIAVFGIFATLTLNFFLFRVLPGDAISNMARVPGGSVELKEALMRQFGLDKPLWGQYLDYLAQIAQGNLGVSYSSLRPVTDEVLRALGNTVPMTLLGILVAILVGVTTGIIAAWKHDTAVDNTISNIATVIYSAPTQWIAIMLVLAFAGYLPVSGASDPFAFASDFWSILADRLKHMILPSLTLALATFGQYTLVTRSAVLATLGEDYVSAAKAQGYPVSRILAYQALPNALVPVVTLIALSAGTVIGGSVVVETAFSWPGIGRAMYDAIVQRDYPMLQGALLVVTIVVILVNLLADLVNMKLDPRIVE